LGAELYAICVDAASQVCRRVSAKRAYSDDSVFTSDPFIGDRDVVTASNVNSRIGANADIPVSFGVRERTLSNAGVEITAGILPESLLSNGGVVITAGIFIESSLSTGAIPSAVDVVSESLLSNGGVPIAVDVVLHGLLSNDGVEFAVDVLLHCLRSNGDVVGTVIVANESIDTDNSIERTRPFMRPLRA